MAYASLLRRQQRHSGVSLLNLAVVFGRPFVKRFALCYQTVVYTVCLSVCLSVCNVGVLWPNDWMDQDETRHAGRLGPGHIVLDGDHAPRPPKGHSLQIFGPYLLWPNGWLVKMLLGTEVGLGPSDIVSVIF